MATHFLCCYKIPIYQKSGTLLLERVKISDEGNIGAVINVSVVFNVEIIVETFNDLTKLAGGIAVSSVDGERPGTDVTESGGSESNKDGEEDKLVHLS